MLGAKGEGWCVTTPNVSFYVLEGDTLRLARLERLRICVRLYVFSKSIWEWTYVEGRYGSDLFIFTDPLVASKWRIKTIESKMRYTPFVREVITNEWFSLAQIGVAPSPTPIKLKVGLVKGKGIGLMSSPKSRSIKLNRWCIVQAARGSWPGVGLFKKISAFVSKWKLIQVLVTTMLKEKFSAKRFNGNFHKRRTHATSKSSQAFKHQTIWAQGQAADRNEATRICQPPALLI